MLAFQSMSPDEEEIVRVPGPGGFSAHRLWIRDRVRANEGSAYEVKAQVWMDDEGRPWAQTVLISALVNRPGLDAAALARIRLDEELEGLLQMELVSTTGEVTGVDWLAVLDREGGEDELVAYDQAAQKAASTAVRRRRPTRELLAKVLELYEEGGIRSVQAKMNYSESYCFKLLRRARQELAS